MLITSLRAAICQSVSGVYLTGVAPLGAVSHRFNLICPKKKLFMFLAEYNPRQTCREKFETARREYNAIKMLGLRLRTEKLGRCGIWRDFRS